MLASWSQAYSPQTVKNKFAFLWTTWSVVLCYSSLNRLRYRPFKIETIFSSWAEKEQAAAKIWPTGSDGQTPDIGQTGGASRVDGNWLPAWLYSKLSDALSLPRE